LRPMAIQDLDDRRGRASRPWRESLERLEPHRRVRAAAVALLALLLVGVLIAGFLLVRLGDKAIDFTRRHIQYSTALSGAALNAKGIANDERGYLLSGSNEFLVEIDIRTAQAREYFDLAAAAADGAQSRRILRASDAFERWLVALEEEIATFRAGDREAAKAASLGVTRDLRKHYESLLATAQLSESGIPHATAAVSRSADRAVVILLAYLVLSMIIGSIVIVWAVRAVRRTSA
jgi:methyl-accepting chemotaxis protein